MTGAEVAQAAPLISKPPLAGNPAAPSDYLIGRLVGHTADAVTGMDPVLQSRLTAMFQSAPADIQAGLGVFSGYRSPERQAQLYAEALKKYGSEAEARRWVAPPGKSQHGEGHAADLAYNGQSFKHAPANVVKWAHETAASFGLAFPLANENWHVETVEARKGVSQEVTGAIEIPLDQARSMRGPVPDWWNLVEQSSASIGVDSDTLYKIGGAESMFRNVQHAGSSAFGPFGITARTWAGLQKNYPDLRLGDRKNVAEQARAAPYLLREYTDDVQRRVGRKITQGEQYLAWFLGPRDAAKVLNAPSGASAAAMITPASVAANPAVFGKAQTVDELRAWADSKMAGNGIDGSDGVSVSAADRAFKADYADDVAFMSSMEPGNPLSDRERIARERALAGDQYSLGQGFYKALGQETTGQLFGWLGRAAGDEDPNFRITQDLLKATAADIPDRYLDALSASNSRADYDRRVEQLRDDLEVKRKLAEMGGTGVALQLGAAVLDPAGWAASIAAAPIGGLAKAGKASRILFGAAEGVAGNLAVEGVTAAVDPTWETDRLLYAAAGGAIFGSVFGSLGRHRDAALKETTALQSAAKVIMTDVETRFGESSAGAAQAAIRRDPVRTDTSEFLTKNFGEFYSESAMGNLRFDLSGRLQASENPLSRALGAVLVEDAVGKKDFSATFRAVSEDQVKLHRQTEAWWERDMRANWLDYAKRNGVNPMFGGAKLKEFKTQVLEAARVSDPAVPFDPAVKAQAATFKGVMKRYLKLAKGDREEFDGTVRPSLPGFANVEPNDAYVPRLVHWGNFRTLLGDIGTNGLQKLVKGAIMGRNDDISEELAERLSKGYVKRLSSVDAGQELTAGRMFSSEDLDELKVNLEEAGLSPDDIRTVLNPVVKDAQDAGKGTPRGKRRQLLSEQFEMALPTKSGEARTVKLSELFENDIDVIFANYNRNMSGQIALAGLRVKNPNFRPDEDAPEFLIDGLMNRGDWDKVTAQVRDVGAAMGQDPKALEADLTRLQFAYDQIAGVPTKFDGTRSARYLRLARDYLFTRVMGQVGFAQVAEIGMLTSNLGWKTAWKSMPQLRRFVQDARSGRLSDDDARQLEWITTGGTDWIRGFSHVREDEFGTPLNVGADEGRLGKVENVMHRMTRAQSAVSGMAAVNTYLQRWAAKGALYGFLDMSEKGARLNRKRLRVMGLDDKTQDRIFENIRTHAGDMLGERDGQVLKRLNLEKWEPETRAAFEHAIFRWTRRLIQENDIGQTNTVLGSTLGRIVFQFRGFMLAGWSKNTLHNIHMRDWESLSSIITTMTFGGLAYVAQTYLQAAGRSDREEFLAKRLSASKVPAAAFQRAGFSSAFPMLADIGSGMLGFDPVFDARVTGTPSQGITSFPLANAVDDLATGMRGVAQAMRRDHRFTERDYRKVASLHPFANTLPMMWFHNSVGGALPAKDDDD